MAKLARVETNSQLGLNGSRSYLATRRVDARRNIDADHRTISAIDVVDRRAGVRTRLSHEAGAK